MRTILTATRWAYSLVAIVVAAGVVLALRTGSWEWFSRAGSLVVVIGIVLTSSQIIEDSRRARRRRQQWEGGRSVAGRDWAQQDVQLRHSRHHDEHLFENEKGGLYILVGGTLIWGFGDLAGRLFTA